jgi:hypothetical protein
MMEIDLLYGFHQFTFPKIESRTLSRWLMMKNVKPDSKWKRKESTRRVPP